MGTVSVEAKEKLFLRSSLYTTCQVDTIWYRFKHSQLNIFELNVTGELGYPITKISKLVFP